MPWVWGPIDLGQTWEKDTGNLQYTASQFGQGKFPNYPSSEIGNISKLYFPFHMLNCTFYSYTIYPTLHIAEAYVFICRFCLGWPPTFLEWKFGATTLKTNKRSRLKTKMQARRHPDFLPPVFMQLRSGHSRCLHIHSLCSAQSAWRSA